MAFSLRCALLVVTAARKGTPSRCQLLEQLGHWRILAIAL